MNSLSSTPLVPEKEVYPVCTNGLQTGTMVVTSQNKMCNAKRHYIATYLDKPTDFKCVYAGILVAIIGGIITALVASGVGATIVGLLIATLAGIIASSCDLGSIVCRYCLERAVWDKFHPNIIIDSKFAIVGSSKLICTPLPFLTPGTIQIFYSKEVANRVAEIYATNNILKIFNGAAVGLGIGAPFALGINMVKAGLPLGKAIGITGGITISGYTIGIVSSQYINTFTDWSSDKLANLYFCLDTENKSDLIGETNTDVFNNKKAQKRYDGISNNPVPGFSSIEYKSYMKGAGRIQGPAVLTKDLWVSIKSDPRYSPQTVNMLKSEYLKNANKTYNNSKSPFAVKETIKTGLKNTIQIMGFAVGTNILGRTFTKILERQLGQFEGAEVEAIKQLGIYENSI